MQARTHRESADKARSRNTTLETRGSCLRDKLDVATQHRSELFDRTARRGEENQGRERQGERKEGWFGGRRYRKGKKEDYDRFYLVHRPLGGDEEEMAQSDYPAGLAR